MRVLRPIRHEDQLSVVDHLDELRSRLIACGLALAVAFAICFWQNPALINVLNRALPKQPDTGLAAQQRTNTQLGDFLREMHVTLNGAQSTLNQVAGELATAPNIPAGVSSQLHDLGTGFGQLGVRAGQAAGSLPHKVQAQKKPITIGVAESFTTSLMVAGYFALLVTLPLLLYELYAFVIPALSRDERRIAIPSMAAAPLLFAAGAIFSYFQILPPAIHFLQGYNSSEFQILIQANAYYKFEILIMLGFGLVFQVPLLLLALQRAGLITARTLTGNWRYAVVLIAIVVASLPGVDPVTMFLETMPLILLYLLSIVMLVVVERRAAKRDARAAAAAATPGDRGVSV